MKKLILPLLGGLALITSGCSSEETVEVPKGQAISFENTFVNKTGRSVDELTANNLTLFKVWGYSSTAVDPNDPTVTGDYIFEGQEVSVVGVQTSYDPPRYWSPNTTYTFMAIASPNMRSDASLPEGTTRSWTFTPGDVPDASAEGYFGTLTFDNSISNGEEDLAYAGAVRTTGATITSSEQAVLMNFNHALSRIRFYFRNDLPDGYFIDVTNIRVSNLPQTGSLDLKTKTWTGKSGSYGKDLAWDERATVGVGAENYIAPTKNNSTEPVYTFPGKEVFKVDFDIDVYMKDGDGYVCTNGNTPYHHSVELQAKMDPANPSVITGLEAGVAYGFSARISSSNVTPGGLKEIEFSTMIDPFDRTSSPTTIIETPTSANGQEESI